MHRDNPLLTARQLAALEASFHHGSSDASVALAKWCGKPSVVEIDSLDQLPLEEATMVLAAGDEPICFCSMEVQGLLTAKMILAFDDASGLALADMVLDQPQGTADEWTEIATSAALETTNILCCAYLNSLSESFYRSGESSVLLPTPPKFSRDFAESLLEFALMGQAVASDQVILTRTRFEIDAAPIGWTLLFVPAAQSTRRLPELLLAEDDEQ
jgi:chemotaxis protein CheC